ncbi:alpha/beta hydrolase [Flavobacteriaceae bacterium S0825]|uniref:dienelactone hydrolase family protein n=1 Tax=Gaetbulibacter sp. S0825 TaxID=2720084 RepID=UPI00142FBB55|nr:dienelactone hydrolase family protein [Gaetbulibacter sp. S0825]MCK0109440.1 alpha/beta hydrolase [Flavobacteriaceae bacterium S0825]NIX65075.1 alpha/beta hydrolase [Gaetbulibacter sp. S0825]
MNKIKTYKEIDIPIGEIYVNGNLRQAQNSKGIILFSHGSGSSRLSSRNNYVADILLYNGFSSLLFDLLTPQEDAIYNNRFDIELLTKRLVSVTKWVKNNEEIKQLPLGYFGASTGAASALSAAAKLGKAISAVVSRGGRPDLAMKDLSQVNTPTLLLVGGNDGVVIELNKKAKANISGICELKIIEGATHLFSEPGKLDIVAKETSDWFDTYLTL